MQGIKEIDFKFKKCTHSYRGKTRNIYFFSDKIVIITTDRISAFDVILPKTIPYKGQVLNQIAVFFLKKTKNILPNYFISSPHPNVIIGKNCQPFKIEMVIRGYLAGHAWREYKKGKRKICGVPLPEGLKENDKLPVPIITPTTKSSEHDQDISKEDILNKKIVEEKDYIQLENFTYKLFEIGTKYANARGLIPADTKYEFGKYKDQIYLIDEIHTPDSSRYFYQKDYEKKQQRGEKQKQLSKEFVRQWLIKNNFQGKKNQNLPEMSEEFVSNISQRYIELYEKLIGDHFIKTNYQNAFEDIEKILKKTFY